MRRGAVQACASVAASAALLAPSSGAAQAVLTVTARGNVPASCAIAATQNFTPANLNAPGSAQANAVISCNQFFRIRATSARGALRSTTPAAGALTNALPYDLRLDVALDDGGVSATCPSAQLLAGQTSCLLSPASPTGLTSAGQIATNRTTTVTISWALPAAPAALVPGSYSDTITLALAAIP